MEEVEAKFVKMRREKMKPATHPYFVRSIIGSVSVVTLLACTKNAEPYSADIISNFVSACTLTGGEQTFCACVIDKIQSEITQSEYAREETAFIMKQKVSDKFVNVLADARAQCVGR